MAESLGLECSDGCDENVDLPFPVSNRYSYITNSLNRRKVRLLNEKESICKSRGPSGKEEANREFWASIQEPYDFIMGTHLIPDIFEIASNNHLTSANTEMELSWDPEDVSPHYVWSYSEFLDQYNELYEWLIQVQLQLYTHSNPPDKNSRLDQQEELRRRIYRRKLFVEQGEKVAEKYPTSEEEIKRKINILNNKWEQLQSTLTPVKGCTEEIAVELDLAQEEKLLRGWLGTMEGHIQPITCKLPRGCSLHSLQERYKDNQVLLKDIKAHGPVLKSVVRQYERQAQSNELDPTGELSSKHSSDIERGLYSFPPEETDTKDKDVKQFRAIPRKARSLEKRYHQIYLRSLEWHYYLEGAIIDFKEQGLSCSTSDSEDEPVSKCRRLSKTSFSSIVSHCEHRKPCSLGWSDEANSLSEAGSYIEDDYVMTTFEAGASRKTALGKKDTWTVRKVLDDTCKDIHNRSQNILVAAATGHVSQVTTMNSSNNNNESYAISPINNNVKYQEILNKNIVISSKRGNLKKIQGSSSVTSNLTKVDRPSPNSGVFDCKHNDTDSDNANDEFTSERKEHAAIENMNELKKRVRSPIGFSRNTDAFEDEEVDQEDLQHIIDSAILDQDWLKSNITTTDSEGSIDEECDKHVIVKQAEEIAALPQQISYTTCDKESIHRLVSYAENLVREPLKSLNPVSIRPHLKPLPLGNPEGKRRQIKQWLSSQSNGIQSLRLTDEANNNNNIQDSCDASGELTTEESDICSNDSDKEGFDTSLATEKGSGIPLLSSENTPTMDGSPSFSLEEKIRGKKRQHTIQRPWSITDENQLFCDRNKIHATTLIKDTGKSILSSSEPALNRLEISSSKNTIFHSYPKIWHSFCAISPDFSKSNVILDSPIVTSDNNNLCATSNRIKEKDSPVLTTSGSLRRRTKLRRRSNRQVLGTQTDSGSDDLLSVCSRRKTVKYTYSPYHSPSKSLSSESETVSGCPKLLKSLSISGECGGQSRIVLTSSTEKCLSDSSAISDVSPIAIGHKFNNNSKGNEDVITKTQKISFTSSHQSRISEQEASLHQEDASSLSEQAWDSYQEYKYLSEPYSEDLDHDAERKLIEFGDDYRNFIDSDGSSFYSFPNRNRRSPRHRRLRIHRNSDSDSDLDNLHNVIAESKAQLSAMEKTLENFMVQMALGLDLEDVISSANANLKFLQDILKPLNREAPKLNSDFAEFHNILDRWGNVQAKALERQQQSAQFRHLQRQVKSLRLNMESVLSRCSSLMLSHTLENFSEIPNKVDEIQSLLRQTETLRSDLSELNVIVHRFTSEMGPAFTPLKDEMAELYRLWDETHRRVNGELSHLQNVSAACHLWEEQKRELSKALKQDSDTLKVIDAAIDSGKLTESVSASVRDVATLLNERRKHSSDGKSKNQILTSEKLLELSKTEHHKKEDRLSDSGTSGYESCSSDDLSERERRLAYLRRLARDLQSSLMPGSNAWHEINVTLDQAEEELKELQEHCRMLILRTAETLEPNSKTSRFLSNSKRRNWVRDGKNCRNSRVERRSRTGGSRRGEWVWRVARAAVPFQVALMLLLCVACLLEPNCCDSVNTFNLSFTPQLRFVHGSPPV